MQATHHTAITQLPYDVFSLRVSASLCEYKPANSANPQRTATCPFVHKKNKLVRGKKMNM